MNLVKVEKKAAEIVFPSFSFDTKAINAFWKGRITI
jgi:hypothetical protein